MGDQILPALSFNYIVSDSPDIPLDKRFCDATIQSLHFEQLDAREEMPFWITGETTLVKFLTCHPCLREELIMWSGNAPLLVSSNYSWDAGTDRLQKSAEGMMRAILYRCFRERPDLVPWVCDQRWKTWRAFDGVDLGQPPWTQKELRETFLRLADGSGNSYRLALFIDGLDEFGDDHQDEIIDILKPLQANPNIKLSVSNQLIKQLSRSLFVWYLRVTVNLSRWRLACGWKVCLPRYPSRCYTIGWAHSREAFLRLMTITAPSNFLHRTVKEWVTEPATAQSIKLACHPGFNPQLTLIEVHTDRLSNLNSSTATAFPQDLSIKPTAPGKPPELQQGFDMYNPVAKILTYASEISDNDHLLRNRLIDVLDCLDRIATPVANSSRDCLPMPPSSPPNQPYIGGNEFSPYHWSRIEFYEFPGETRLEETCFVAVAAQHGVLSYVKKVVSERPELVNAGPTRPSLLEHALFGWSYAYNNWKSSVGWQAYWGFGCHLKRHLEMVRFIIDKVKGGPSFGNGSSHDPSKTLLEIREQDL
ncbi:hypothetical protein B0H66DRAFT_620838 [Apodospora peruviana]|uniref:Nephrocystin 3-like N-terminal domain-containing protein n=1 Tax=Apodospora peruviana TaxID=516989 RepID=A0AAE0IDD5_9PEZI|nr:hypothetical protein B0H66DRAFT_620838 [Apodospora peruviana]